MTWALKHPVIRIQNPEYRIQNPESRIQNPDSRIQAQESGIQNPAPKPSIPFKSQSSVSGTPSIKDALSALGKTRPGSDQPRDTENLPEEVEEIIEIEEQPPVSKEELDRLWKNYIERWKQNSPRVYLALSSQQPELQDDGLSIGISFRNNALLAEFRQNYKIPLLAYLKENLQNSLLEFEETILDIESSSITKHYTDLDKLKHMIEKNPALQKLRQEFNLDFD